MFDKCECASCADKRKAGLSVIELTEKKFAELYKKNIYSLGVPKAKIQEILNQVKEEVR